MFDSINEAINGAEKVPEFNEVEMICMSDIEMKPIEWLWSERIACGKITVIAGNPGLGKSQLTAWLASVVTQGASWLDGHVKAKQGEVVFLSAEDDAADTIKPRLMAAGADVSRCHVLEAVNVQAADGKISKRGFDLSQDIERVGKAIESRTGGVRLVIIDPISAYLGKVDSNKNAEVRGLMMQLNSIAQKHGVAMLLITHNSKDDKKSVINKPIGSIGMVAAARAAYTVEQDTKTPEVRYFLPIKNNIGNDKDGFAYEIKSVELPEGISTSCIEWDMQRGAVSAKEILNPEPVEKTTAINGAKAFLEGLLADGAMLMIDVIEEAEGAGYSKGSIQRAAQRIGVSRKKQGMKGGWLWKLPKSDIYGNLVEDTEDDEGSNDLSVIPLINELQSSEDSISAIEGMTPNNMHSSIPSQSSCHDME